ncbi:hypothetical protein CONCODRAFT_12246 [Conidiobolus coronatus NRRL 28638]|uniref:Uncharacterized protein n=1 Tax=Conidiobolus coronatus (strain ATCC 28846 / CBS 209.66 / NRRL 28638) TaxID=796925 RepID=A0A137NTD5_CONC2|nr:hypothetical protein CONCODRAFT_12246 [Conidiobolus coronatus NRRL 28638]|eukprot:KXN66006.1 hypothetical protein CONCODRAFT_12246 [Conidiobolus coronatus NRRL 28638]
MKLSNKLLTLIALASAQSQQTTDNIIPTSSTTDSASAPIYTGDILYDGSQTTSSAKLSYVFLSVGHRLYYLNLFL